MVDLAISHQPRPPKPSDVRYTLYCKTPEVSDGKVHCRTPGTVMGLRLGPEELEMI